MDELRIEGEYIERLVLSRNDGHREVLDNLEETVELPVGEYLLQGVRVKGGYKRWSVPQRSHMTIGGDK